MPGGFIPLSDKPPLTPSLYVHETRLQHGSPGFIASSSIGAGSCSGTAAASSISISIFGILAVLFASLNIDTNPLSISIASKVHGRVDVCMLICQTILVIVVNVWSSSIPPLAIAACILIIGLVWVAASLVMMPYYKHSM